MFIDYDKSISIDGIEEGSVKNLRAKKQIYEDIEESSNLEKGDLE